MDNILYLSDYRRMPYGAVAYVGTVAGFRRYLRGQKEALRLLETPAERRARKSKLARMVQQILAADGPDIA